MNDLENPNCCGPSIITSWYDLQKMSPVDPLGILENAILDSTVGQFEFSTTYIEPGTWTPTPLTISNEPLVTALESDNQLKVADANMWMFNHKRWNSSSALAIPLRKILFLRGVHEWRNRLYIDFGGTPITAVQLSLITNAATRGDRQGTTPVISWAGLSLTDEHTIDLVFRTFGQFDIGIWTYDGTNHSIFELKIIVMP
ncbi:MAG: hypothetical protein M5R41_17765 [Bacteroidia bacterium]|nr:hypothetical protein [Bacteroidia bacterium]